MNVQKTKPQTPPASAQQQAYMFLREQIQGGRLAGGQRIRLEDVAAELGISRMPIREAIRQLDTEGLLTIRPNRGAVVTMFSSGHLTELFEMRAVLEGLCARSAATTFDEDAGDELTLLVNRLNRAQGNPDLWIERHEDGLIEVRRLRAAAEPCVRPSLMHPVLNEETARQHRELVDVMLTRDPERAEAAMRHHVESTAGDFLTVLPPVG
jgi:DNA-binding GntR family transcriptional regulator